MNNVDRLLNTTVAGFIARNLDEKDGKKDNKISASVWNDFVKDKGGKEVKEFITVEDAMKSITKYLLTEAKKLVKNVDELAKEWDARTKKDGSVENPTRDVGEDEGNVDETPDSPSTDKTGKTPETEETPVVTPKKGKEEKIDYNSVKITVPVRYADPDLKSIYRSRNEGKNLSASLKKGNIKGITSKNVAYALTKDINFGPNSQIQARFVFENLIAKMKDIDILEDKDCQTTLAFSKLSYKQQNVLLHQYRNRIVSYDNDLIRKDNKDKADFNKHRGIMQNAVNNANRLLVDVANMNPKPKITVSDKSDDKHWKMAKLPDGRYIKAYYDIDGTLEHVDISYDTQLNSRKTDDYEVQYYGSAVYCNYDKTNISDEFSFDYKNFDKIKTLAEKIFG